MKHLTLPGMIDVHTHLRDPGATDKEDFFTGTSSALSGGVTLLLDMPNNPIPTISLKALKEKEKIAEKKAVCDYGLIFGASQDDNTDQFKKVIPKVAALKIYMDQTTGTLLVERLGLLEKIFKMWKSEKPIMVHAEDATLAKALSFADLYKRHVHFCHVSLASEVLFIKKAKERGLKVSAEVTPHHLFLTEDDQKRLGPYGIMKPPLRKKEDVKALWFGIMDGTIDMIGTDHAPHTLQEKESKKPPYGVTGLETALPLLLNVYEQKKLMLNQVINLYHTNPRKIFKLPKQINTHIEVDMDNQYEIKNNILHTKCKWSPFNGMKLYGRIKTVVLRGKKVYEDGEVLVGKGFGKNINEIT